MKSKDNSSEWEKIRPCERRGYIWVAFHDYFLTSWKRSWPVRCYVLTCGFRDIPTQPYWLRQRRNSDTGLTSTERSKANEGPTIFGLWASITYDRTLYNRVVLICTPKLKRGLFKVHLAKMVHLDKKIIIAKYCKTRIFRVPFISRISWPWRIRENNGPQIYILAAVY